MKTTHQVSIARCLRFVAAIVVYGVLAIASAYAQSSYHGADGKKIILSDDKTRLFIAFKAASAQRMNTLQNIQNIKKIEATSDARRIDANTAYLDFNAPQAKNISDVLKEMNVDASEIEFATFGKLFPENDAPIMPTNLISYRLKEGRSIREIEPLFAGRTERDMIGPMTVLRITNPSIDVFDLSNAIYESGAVVYAHPVSAWR